MGPYILRHPISICIFKEDELGIFQFENIQKGSYKSPGVLSVW